MAQTELITAKATIIPLLLLLEWEGCSAAVEVDGAVAVDEELKGEMVVVGDVTEPEFLVVGAEILG